MLHAIKKPHNVQKKYQFPAQKSIRIWFNNFAGQDAAIKVILGLSSEAIIVQDTRHFYAS